MSDSDVVLCHTVHSQLVPVPRSALVFRPTVYGIATHDNQVLSLPNRLNGRWELPGGTLRTMRCRKDLADEPSGVRQWATVNDLSPDNLSVGYKVVMKAVAHP